MLLALVTPGSQALLLTIQLLTQQKSMQRPLCTGRELRMTGIWSCVDMYMCSDTLFSIVVGPAEKIIVLITSQEAEGFYGVCPQAGILTESAIWPLTTLPQVLIGSLCSSESSSWWAAIMKSFQSPGKVLFGQVEMWLHCPDDSSGHRGIKTTVGTGQLQPQSGSGDSAISGCKGGKEGL